ncbi:MAG: transcription antitermination factor NusB [Magnetospiraceae bacterium]
MTQKESKYSGSARSAARLAAVQALYEGEIAGSTLQTLLTDSVQRRWRSVPMLEDDSDELAPAVEPDVGHLTAVLKGVFARKDDLDQMISGALAEDWPLDRLETLLKCVMRAGAFELLDRTQIPPKVIITEYVEVARAFFDKGEAAMVNGVLDRLAHLLRDAEMSPAP